MQNLRPHPWTWRHWTLYAARSCVIPKDASEDTASEPQTFHSPIHPDKVGRKAANGLPCFAATSRSSPARSQDRKPAAMPTSARWPSPADTQAQGPWMGPLERRGRCLWAGAENELEERAPWGRGSVRTCQLVTRPSAAGRAAASRHPLRCLCPLFLPFRSLLEI